MLASGSVVNESDERERSMSSNPTISEKKNKKVGSIGAWLRRRTGEESPVSSKGSLGKTKTRSAFNISEAAV
jgi:hypothetical protein